MPRAMSSKVVWRGSMRHVTLFRQADMFFVSTSWKDIVPNNRLNLFKKIIRPIVYLQHGTLGIKKLGYSGNSYNNNLFRFVTYNPKIKNSLIAENSFKDYQIHFSGIPPRYKKLIELDQSILRKSQILWFLTWREYIADNPETDSFIEKIAKLAKNQKLIDYLELHDKHFKIFLHKNVPRKVVEQIRSSIASERISVDHSANTDIMYEIAKSDRLITDYSSLGFDFTFLKKPVLIYQFDKNEYMKARATYCDMDKDFLGAECRTQNQLVEKIIEEDSSLNPFFYERTYHDYNFEDVADGVYIDKLYEHFKAIQKKRITFIGYNFYGQGGTVTATKAMAEALLERGYLVELLSLKRGAERKDLPSALNIRGFFKKRPEQFYYRFVYFIFRWSNWGSLEYDPNKDKLIPYTAYRMRRYLKQTRSETVISTRESMHLFLHDAQNTRIKNKIYYFHTSALAVDKLFPGLVSRLQSTKLSKVAFVTKEEQKQYKELLGYDNYEKSLITGNALESSKMLDRDHISKRFFQGVYLARISKDRRPELKMLLSYAQYLKDNKITNIQIQVFGSGDYRKHFKKLIKLAGVRDILVLRPATIEPHLEIREHDFGLSMSEVNSFGMTYIEFILNGKLIFARKNHGAEDVLKGLEGLFFEDFEDLTNKILATDKVSKEELLRNYDSVLSRFSREKVSESLIQLL